MSWDERAFRAAPGPARARVYLERALQRAGACCMSRDIQQALAELGRQQYPEDLLAARRLPCRAWAYRELAQALLQELEGGS